MDNTPGHLSSQHESALTDEAESLVVASIIHLLGAACLLYRRLNNGEVVIRQNLPRLTNPHIVSPAEPSRTSFYQDLNDGHVRLLEIIPSANFDDELKCRMIYARLQDNPKYIAISYNWGERSTTSHILVNNTKMEVTKNLLQALRAMRAHGKRCVWADAVCINQQNASERNQQVLRMRAIYQQAEEVAVWLGPEENDSDEAMNLIKQHQPDVTEFSDHQWVSLRSLLSRPYWERVWIIQEITAARDIRLYCGKLTIGWDAVEKLVQYLLQVQGGAQPQILVDSHFVRTLVKVRQKWKRPPYPTLLEILCLTSQSASERPHDKIYGILGLSSDHQHFVPEPNYDMDQAKMCRDMTENFIMYKRSLDIIFLRPFLEGANSINPLSLPSWCPDYLHIKEKPLDPDIIKYLSGEDRKHRAGVFGSRWQATQDSRPQVEIREGCMDSYSIALGTIVSLGAIDEKEVEQREFPKEAALQVQFTRIDKVAVQKALRRLLLLHDEDYGTLHDVLSRRQARLRRPWRYKNWNAFDKSAMQRWVLLNQDFAIRGYKPLCEPTSVGVSGTGASAKGKSVRMILQQDLRIMAMTDGNVGLAARHARVGDQIFLLPGCSAPVVLRQRLGDVGYTVVGYSFVHDAMNGERWNESQLCRISIF